MKIVINRCYGGFGLSKKAIARLAELNGQKAYFFTGGIGGRPRIEVSVDDDKECFVCAYNTPTPSESPSPEEWHRMSYDQKRVHNAKTDTERLDSRPENRADPKLVKVVEELGDEANGFCAKLKIIEIPDGVDWEIDEYDGMEKVSEKHRSW
jgi:hypothetical protein